MRARANVRRAAAGATVLAAAALMAAGCGGGSKSSGGGGSAGSSAKASTSTVSVRHVQLGSVLVGGNGTTLYLFEKDSGPKSTCAGACATAWPPLTVKGKPTGGAGVKAALLGTTKRKDGTVQVTYAGHPLYYYSGDHSPGQTSGEGLKAFGAEWYVLSPSGKKVEEEGASTSSKKGSSSSSGNGYGY
jgi:predicted lipoprotein with Yx(FWY)xxD motif